MNNPKSISVSVVGRNDNYGSNLEHRAVLCLNNLIQKFDEVIFVDWVSPEKSLIKSIEGDLIKSGKLKVYEVSQADVDQKNPEYSKYVIVESVARNIGLRRSNCDWWLSTNIDVMLDYFDTDDYDNSTMYTVGRRNVPEGFHLDQNNKNNLLNLLLQQKDSWPRAQNTVGYEESGKPIPLWDCGDIWSLVLGPGDFLFAHKNVWNEIKGFEERFGGRFYTDSNVLKKAALSFGYENIKRADQDVFHMDHDSHPGQRHIVDEGKELPMNDQNAAVPNFEKTHNSDDWGWHGYDLTSYVL